MHRSTCHFTAATSHAAAAGRYTAEAGGKDILADTGRLQFIPQAERQALRRDFHATFSRLRMLLDFCEAHAASPLAAEFFTVNL